MAFYKFSGDDDFAPYYIYTCTCVFDRMTVNKQNTSRQMGKL